MILNKNVSEWFLYYTPNIGVIEQENKIKEEKKEREEALKNRNLKAFLDAIGDIYCAYIGYFVSIGLTKKLDGLEHIEIKNNLKTDLSQNIYFMKGNIDSIFNDIIYNVNSSNWSKTIDSDGNIKKGQRYFEPDIKSIIDKYKIGLK